MFFGGLFKDLAEVKEDLARVELVGPQDEFAADVLGRMDGHAVGILARLELGDASHPTWGYRLLVWQLFAVFCAAWCSCCGGWHSAPQWRLFIGKTTLFWVISKRKLRFLSSLHADRL